MEALKEIINDDRNRKKQVDVETALKNIAGIIPNEEMSLEEYRNERLEKYASLQG